MKLVGRNMLECTSAFRFGVRREMRPRRRYREEMDIHHTHNTATRGPEERRPQILRARPAGEDHQVLTVAGGEPAAHCRRPCADCPWRKDAVGVFPPEAFRHSAETAYDMATHTFACHAAGAGQPRLCAGFLLRGAAHNLTVRLMQLRGLDLSVTDGGHALHASYAAMAVANGVAPDDPALAPCRSNDE